MPSSTSSRADASGAFSRWVIFSLGIRHRGTPCSNTTGNGVKKDEWRKAYANVLSRNKEVIDLSLLHIDGSHTLALRSGECIEYQERKKRKTTNALFFTDNQGLPLAMSEPQAGNHANLYEIKDRVDEIAEQLMEADIPVDGLFCDLDAGFDGDDLRIALDSHGIISNVCPNRRNGGQVKEERLFDEEMYKERWKIERTNAWIDGFKNVLVRFDTTVSSWEGWTFLAFIVSFLNKNLKSN